ncbi:MAG: hypothetical protein PF450_16150, partial [Bacteroidales bacterium]|nr:hypothetical protein [Bacteroidales bacterium]
MKTRKAAFHYPWPVIIEDSDQKQNEIAMIKPYYQTMKRYKRFKQNILDNHTIKKMQLTVDKIFSVREEYHA